MDAKKLIKAMETAYDVTLPARYKKFLEGGEHERYPAVKLSGYIRGPYDLNFLDELLADVAELGINAGISDMDDVPWSTDYAAYVPLASLSHEDVDEPKMFLVLDVETKGNPVLLFDQEGWVLFPLAKTFEAFLKALPAATTAIKESFNPGRAAADD